MEKLEAIGVLAGGIAHDFNNLLTGILGNLSIAELYIKKEDPIFEILKRAKSSSQRAGDLTKQLLTFSKGGAPIKKPTAITELIEETGGFSLRGSSVKCEYSFPDDLFPVEIDKGQISQVISNLIINADHAMPNGGTIKLSAENVIIRGDESLPLKEGKYVKLAVEDYGTGISRENLSKIFDPYFTTKEHGSGLGLASCYSIIINHGGYISVESELGIGTTFHIYLPASEKEVFKVEGISEELPLLGRGKILFMDDEEDVINAGGQMLIELGYEVECAKNGTEAVELYQKAKKAGEPFEAVILDLTVPGGMGGQETIQKLLKIDPGVKAIVSSGYSNLPMMAEYKSYGFKGVVAKPYEINELSKVLYKLINRIEESSGKV
jgi:CheY-like chemotaxis protein